MWHLLLDARRYSSEEGAARLRYQTLVMSRLSRHLLLLFQTVIARRSE